jgi:naphthalene 1,2-dioxygenase system ferredoxin subunit
MAENDNWVALLKLSTVEMDEVEAVEVNGLKLAVFHLEDGSVHVTRNVCTHEFALLSEGWFEGCEIECPLHAGRFDVRTGEALCSPLMENLKTYAAKVEDGVVFAKLPIEARS